MTLAIRQTCHEYSLSLLCRKTTLCASCATSVAAVNSGSVAACWLAVSAVQCCCLYLHEGFLGVRRRSYHTACVYAHVSAEGLSCRVPQIKNSKQCRQEP